VLRPVEGNNNMKELCTYVIVSLSIIIRRRDTGNKIFLEKIETLFSFFLNPSVYEKIWKKYCIAVQATDENVAHAFCMLCN